MGNLGFHIMMMCPTCNGEGVVNSVERDRAKACSAMADPEGEIAAMRVAMRYAYEHILELEDAWRRGCINESDGKGGTRSNRNIEARNRLRTALGEEVQGG